MEPIELLWDLESQWKLLDSYKSELDDLNNNLKIKSMEKKVIGLEKRLQSSKSKKNKTEEKLRTSEKKLKINNFNMKDLKKSLYDGNITDLKQLEYLNKEKNSVEGLISSIETEVLEFMEEVEEIDEEISNIENELQSILGEEDELSVRQEQLKKAINLKIEAAKKDINLDEKNIDDSILTNYYKVKESRGRGIVELKNSTCTGCNIMIPILSLERIKSKDGIYNCESCGRILYYKE